MKVLVTGAGGMVGRELVRALGEAAVPRNRAELDITDFGAVRDAILKISPRVVINAAAFTNVDAAEDHRDEAFAVNGGGAENVARAASEAGAFCIHISTDFVFDGTLGRAYTEDDDPNPIGVYAASKLRGEMRVEAAHSGAAIVRTAWVYGAGHRTFLSAVLDRSRSGEQLRVVTDQIGSPTWVNDLAEALVSLSKRPSSGIFHVAGGGEASRYDFARAILEAAGEDPSKIEPVTTDQFPASPAKRPPYAPLEPKRWTEKGFEPLRHWRDALAEAIKDFG